MVAFLRQVPSVYSLLFGLHLKIEIVAVRCAGVGGPRIP